MLANDVAAVEQGLDAVMSQFCQGEMPRRNDTLYACPACGLEGLSEVALRRHFPLYHASEKAAPHDCPICNRRASSYRAFAVHLHNKHGPIQEREPVYPAFNAFSWVICRRPSDGHMLLCHEPAAIAGGRPNYWFPAGRVDAGETFVQAAERETVEEAGVRANVKGVLLFQLSESVVPRILFYAEPVDTDARSPKSVPDFESCGAVWLHVSELDNLAAQDFRGGGTADLYRAVASGQLQPLPLDTPAFRALEGMVQRLTTDANGSDEILRRQWAAEVGAVWKQLKKQYPHDRMKIN